VQVDPASTPADPACFQRLDLTYDKLLSNLAFNYSLRPFSKVGGGGADGLKHLGPGAAAAAAAERRLRAENFAKVGRCRLTPGFRG